MLTVYKNGKLTVKKDGTSYYRVFDGRKRIGSFLFKEHAINYIENRLKGGSK